MIEVSLSLRESGWVPTRCRLDEKEIFSGEVIANDTKGCELVRFAVLICFSLDSFGIWFDMESFVVLRYHVTFTVLINQYWDDIHLLASSNYFITVSYDMVSNPPAIKFPRPEN